MTKQSDLDLASLYPYLLKSSLRDDDLLKQLRAETERDDMSRMQIAPEQGQFMALLVQLMNAKRIIEIGTYTGYSSLCMARALPEDGRLVCCDVSEPWTRVAQKYWRLAKVDHKIKLHLAPALETLQQLNCSKEKKLFDLAFIDADKTNYAQYYEQCLQLIRPNGLIIFDNVLWGGRVADPSNQDADTVALRALNSQLLNDDRVDISMLPMADGLTLARKRH